MVRLPRPAESFSENLLVSAHKASIHSKARQVVSNPASSGSHAAPVRLVSPHPVSYFKITKAVEEDDVLVFVAARHCVLYPLLWLRSQDIWCFSQLGSQVLHLSRKLENTFK